MHKAALDYLKWYHETNVWKHVTYRGVRTLKLPSDMWNYQEIFSERDIGWVIETGSRHGGSAMYFADLLRNSSRHGRVFSIDLQPMIDPRALADERIERLLVMAQNTCYLHALLAKAAPPELRID